jgi:Flp pilus assembly protein CpaB
MSTPVITRDTAADHASDSHARRPVRTRFTLGHVAFVVVALLAGLANYTVLAGRQPQAEVLVAAQDLQAGHVLTAADLHAVTIVVDGPVKSSFVPATLDLSGQVLVADLAAGAPVRIGDVRPAAGRDGLRRMSLPISRDVAVGGAITRGDRVDVLLADDGNAHYLVVDAEVVAVAESGGSPLEGLGGYFLTIAVDTPSARCLAAGLTTGQLTVVLSTGADAVTPDGCTEDGALIPLVIEDLPPGTRSRPAPSTEPAADGSGA